MAASLGCFEDRIQEVLTIGIGPNGGATFHYQVSLHDVDAHGDTAEGRVRQFQHSLEQGSTPWMRAFRHSSRDTVWQRNPQRGRQAHQCLGLEPNYPCCNCPLPELLFHTSIQAQVDHFPGSLGVTLFPGPALGGNRSQRRRMDGIITSWSESLSDYLQSVADLWDYIEANPSRRLPLLDEMFSDFGGGDDREGSTLSAHETSMTQRYEEAETAVVEIFDTPMDEARSAQELSRLIYDPYPLQFLIALTNDQGEAIRSTPTIAEGLEAHGDFAWGVPRTSLWDTFARFEGRWIAPDPLTAKVRFSLQAQDNKSFDVDRFAQARFLVHHVPSGSAIQEEVLAGLAPPHVSHIVWRTND